MNVDLIFRKGDQTIYVVVKSNSWSGRTRQELVPLAAFAQEDPRRR
jgi:hypothetical protein